MGANNQAIPEDVLKRIAIVKDGTGKAPYSIYVDGQLAYTYLRKTTIPHYKKEAIAELLKEGPSGDRH